MKKLTCKSAVIILAAIVMFSSLNNGFATQKRGIDSLKYPELNSFKLPEITKSEIPNGIKLRLIKSDKLPLVNMVIMVKGGSVYDPPSKVGLSSIMTQLLRIGGVKNVSGDEMDKLLDSKGISIDISASDDSFNISLSCLKDNFEDAVSLLSRILKEPVFSQEKLDETVTRMASLISRRNDQPSPIASREFNKLIYGAGSPFAAVQEYEHLDNITRDDVAAMYKRFIAPDNMLAGIAGPLEMSEVKQIFEKYFGDWNTKAQLPPFPVVKEQAHDFKVAFIEKSGLNQSYLSIGNLGIKTNLPEMAKIKVFNSIFSTSFASRLMSRIRVKMGLTYGVSGGIISQDLYEGVTSFSTFTKSESTIDAIKAIFEEIERIRKEKVTDKELGEAKNSFLNSYVFNYSSPARILSNSLQKEFYGYPENYEIKLQEDIKNVSVDDMLNVAQKYLSPEKMMIVIVGSEKLIKGDLSQFGKIKKLDISIPAPALKEKIPPADPGTLAKGKKIIDSLAEKNYKGYKLLKSMETISDVKMMMRGQTIPMSTKMIQVLPGKMYMEISVMGMKIEQIVDGKKGVMKQMGQVKSLSEEDIEKNTFGDLADVFTSKDKYSFQYLKEETIDGKKYDVIYAFDAKKNWIKFFVNTQTNLIELEEKVTNAFGQSGVGRVLFFDIKTIEGIPSPSRIETYIKNEKIIDVTIKEVKVNSKVDPLIFKIEEKM
jgi:zinc protease